MPASLTETAAVLALLGTTPLPAGRTHEITRRLEQDRSAWPLLEELEGLLAPLRAHEAAGEMARWQATGIQVLTVLDDAYPALLRAAPDHPPALYLRGSLDPADARAVAVIGTRHPSDGGLAAARTLTRRLAAHGHTIVSGLARGTDAAAHAEALAAGARTLAVIGTGPDRCYPPEHAALQAEIAGRAAVVSRFPPGTPPSRHTFPLRNAVSSGLSLATVIVEAGERSGTRIQARRAIEQGRLVVLRPPLLAHAWARELSDRPGTLVTDSPDELLAALARLPVGRVAPAGPPQKGAPWRA